MDVKNKKVLIMGLGLHGGGVGTAKFLVSQGADVLVTDLKSKRYLVVIPATAESPAQNDNVTVSENATEE